MLVGVDEIEGKGRGKKERRTLALVDGEAREGEGGH